jgi:hypothetical protein
MNCWGVQPGGRPAEPSSHPEVSLPDGTHYRLVLLPPVRRKDAPAGHQAGRDVPG